MTRLLRAVTTAACALALLAVPPAHATPSSFHGDCGFDAISQDDVTGPDVYTGVLYGAAVLFGYGHRNVVNAIATCEIRVNGVTHASTSQWGSGVVAFADTVTYTATDTDDVDLCTTVDFTSDDTPTVKNCAGYTTTQMPPKELFDLADLLFLWVNAGLVTADPALCTASRALAPGTPPVTIAADGDVFVEGERWWDCPPHASPMPEAWGAGGGYNTGDAGALLLRDPDRQVAAACAYVTDRATGTIAVAGAATEGDIRCVLTDTATGTVLYDETAPAQHATIPANDGPVTVCTAGPVDLRCRPGEPLGRRS